MLAPGLVAEKVRERVSVMPCGNPLRAPVRAVGEPLRGVKGMAAMVPEDAPLNVPVIEVAETTLPCRVSETVGASLLGKGEETMLPVK